MTVEALTGHLEDALCEIAAVKARAPREIHAEARLHRRLRKLIEPSLRKVRDAVASEGAPSDDLRVRGLLLDLEETSDDLLELLIDEASEEALRGVRSVESKVAAAQKAITAVDGRLVSTDRLKHGELDLLRPRGVDRKVFQSVNSVRNSTLSRLLERAARAVTDAAGTDSPVAALDDTFSSLLDFELRRMSRHALRDAHETAVIETEKDLGVRRHRWVTAGDDAVRESHAAVDGEVVEVGEPFSNGWTYPGQIGCRCHLEPVLDAA